MTMLPIVERELRVAARNKLTYRGRVTVALIASVAVIWTIYSFNRLGFRGLGAGKIFAGMSSFVFIFCLFAGAGSTVDSISLEKREGTIGLLFLTHIGGWEIVLGKLISSSLTSFYGLMGAIPALSIIMLIGGVEPWALFRTSLALLNTLFYGASAGLLISTFCTDGRKIMGMISGVIWFLFMGAPNMLGRIPPASTAGHVVAFLQWFNPGAPVFRAYTATSTPDLLDFWLRLALIHGIGWGCLLISSWTLPRQWMEKTSGLGAFWKSDRWRNWTFGPPPIRIARRSKMLAINPIFWLTCRRRWGPVAVWIMFGLILALTSLVWLIPGKGGPYMHLAIFGGLASFILYMWLRVSVLQHSSRHLMEHRQSGAIELLASAPLSVKEIVGGLWLGLRNAYAGPVTGAVLFQGSVCLAGFFLNGLDTSKGDWNPTIWGIIWVAGISIFVADIFTLGWSGMLAGMTSKPNAPKNSTAALVMAMPWLLGLFFGIVLEQIFGIRLPLEVKLIGWALASLAIDITIIIHTRKTLLRDFRTLATERFQPEETNSRWWAVWERFGRRGKPAT